MLLRRVLALLVAVGLVVGAVQVRTRLFGPGTADPVAGADVRLVCLRELADVCTDLAPGDRPPQIEDAATTVARFTQRDPGVDVWLTISPWPEMAANARARAQLPELTAATGDVLARSPVLLAARRDRSAVLEADCPDGEITWRCVGDHADDPWQDLGGQSGWGRVKVGLDQPAERAQGLLTLAQITADWFDGGQLTSQSLGSPEYFAWLSDLGAAVDPAGGQSPLERMLLTGGADYEFTGALESVAVPLLRSAPQRAEGLTLRRLAPEVTADVVAVGYGDVDAAAVDELGARLAAPLRDAGWRVEGGPAPSEAGGAALPASDGLSSAAVLEVLRQNWIEVAGRG